ncbi:hypothetical protein BGZ99_007033 [Dissophora globulifera]|uniref:Uncharacterized protein n=1 Tax=Dissophora globulifera TaxID=979702 RepID=A0A9P6URI6_9FUNG|nr:hypothetical protein BGZ99_007033 [Dissophora globulifera]
MDIKIVSSITRLANYMPLGSYVIYTALETYSFSLGSTPAPVTTIVQTPTSNYTCYYYPGAAFTYTTCTADQSNALVVSLSIGFFLAVFLSFLKQVPNNGTVPLADSGEDETTTAGEGGNFYYLDFGDSHIWGHAALSFVAFGTLSLFSASVSQCLFPSVKPWIFVFTQIILLVICCFIAMFWIDDPSLSIGLMVVPQTDNDSTQTFNGGIRSYGGSGPIGPLVTPAVSTAVSSTTTTSTSTTALTSPNGLALGLSPDSSRTSAGLANVALADTVMNSAMSMTSISALSSASTVVGAGNGSGTGSGMGGGVSRISLQAKRVPTMSSVTEKHGYEDQDDIREWRDETAVYQEQQAATAHTTLSQSASMPAPSEIDAENSQPDHLTLKMD